MFRDGGFAKAIADGFADSCDSRQRAEDDVTILGVEGAETCIEFFCHLGGRAPAAPGKYDGILEWCSRGDGGQFSREHKADASARVQFRRGG